MINYFTKPSLQGFHHCWCPGGREAPSSSPPALLTQQGARRSRDHWIGHHAQKQTLAPHTRTQPAHPWRPARGSSHHPWIYRVQLWTRNHRASSEARAPLEETEPASVTQTWQGGWNSQARRPVCVAQALRRHPRANGLWEGVVGGNPRRESKKC